MTRKYYKTKRDIPPTAPSQSDLFGSVDTDHIPKKMWEKFIHSKFYGEMYKDKSGHITKEVDDKHISVIFLTNDGLKTFTKFRNSQIYLKPQETNNE